MAMKAILTREEHSALAEPLRAHYAEKDGKFVLGLEGDLPEIVEARARLDEFRTNNRKLHTELEELRPLKVKYDGIDPEEHKKLKTEVEQLRAHGVKGPDDLEARIKDEVERHVRPVKEKLAASEKREQEAQQRFIDKEFESLISEVATKNGVRAQAVSLILTPARSKFEYKDGQLVAKAGVKHPEDSTKDFTPLDWVHTLAKEQPYLFEASEGGGANGNRNRERSNVATLVNPSSEEMGRNMDKIAKGEIKVVRT